ncbi:MAG: bifunctional demethylmenaquinone methyltransferase/2-methoxy-6-polyprenyl-1,4-benzoquinol methylase UbiE [archaeon]|nr:bifunctional demethylmenaquinone methyltransferase/2-methoxy-6-polyprenyl-1,4-benzoquinol methylase UbiE [archaeon]
MMLIDDHPNNMSKDREIGNQFDGKEKYVKDVFQSIATRYDKVNNIMSVGMIKHWHKFMFKKAGNISGFHVADVGCGTGEITLMASKKVGKNGAVKGIDITLEMLEIARAKERNMNLFKNIEWVIGDALNIQYPDNTFDLVTSGYMLRNVTDIPKAISEMFRILKPKHKVIIAELAMPKNKIFRFVHNIYVFKIVPWYGRHFNDGKIIDGKMAAYDWLTLSLKNFPYGDDMVKILKEKGFTDTKFYSKSFGAINIYVGTKP